MKQASRHGRRGAYSNAEEFLRGHPEDMPTDGERVFCRTTDFGPPSTRRSDRGYIRDSYTEMSAGRFLRLFAVYVTGRVVSFDEEGRDIVRSYLPQPEDGVSRRYVAWTTDPRLIRFL